MSMSLNANVPFATPATTSRPPNVGLMLAQRRRRWANNHPTLGERRRSAPYIYMAYMLQGQV